jgi:hypothetical protein
MGLEEKTDNPYLVEIEEYLEKNYQVDPNEQTKDASIFKEKIRHFGNIYYKEANKDPLKARPNAAGGTLGTLA